MVLGSRHTIIRTALLVLAVTLALMASSCTIGKPRVNLILKPSNVANQAGDNPLFDIRHIARPNYHDYMVDLATPEGDGVYLVLGDALAAAYRYAIVSYYLSPKEPRKGKGVTATVLYDELEFESSATVVSDSMVRVRMTLKHSIHFSDRERTEKFTVPVEASLTKLMGYRDAQDYIVKATDLAADLLYIAQQSIYDSLKAR